MPRAPYGQTSISRSSETKKPIFSSITPFLASRFDLLGDRRAGYVLPWLREDEGSVFSLLSWVPSLRRLPRRWQTRRGLAPGATTLLRHRRLRGARPPRRCPCHGPRRPPRMPRSLRLGPRAQSHPKGRPPWRRHHLAMKRRSRRRPLPPRLARRRRLAR
jgi:hypothetical protein